MKFITLISLIILSSGLTRAQVFTPHLDSTNAITLKEGIAPVPIGLYSMITVNTILKDTSISKKADRSIYRIAKHKHISAIALSVWVNSISFSNEDRWNFSNVEKAIKEIESAAKLENRKLLVFIKWYFEYLPNWMTDDLDYTTNGDPYHYEIKESETGIPMLIKYKRGKVAKTDSTVDAVPINTNNTYKIFFKEGIREIGAWLEIFDPSRTRISMTSTIAPSLRSNHMRILDPDSTIHLMTTVGWTFEGHRNVFVEMANEMTKHQGFKGRCWVFNMTNQVGEPYKGYDIISTFYQTSVIDSIKTFLNSDHHLLVKHESMTVNLMNKITKIGVSKCDTPSAAPFLSMPGGSYRHNFLKRSLVTPYKYIAEQILGHGYENWGSMYYSRDMVTKFGQNRQSCNYPFDSLIANSTKLDLHNRIMKKPQGTLWNEIWVQEARVPDEKCRYYNYPNMKDTSYTLLKDLVRWNDSIIGNVKTLLNRQSSLSGINVSNAKVSYSSPDQDLAISESIQLNSSLKLGDNFIVYPNPMSEVINIKSNYPVQDVWISNNLGNIVLKTTGIENKKVDIRILSPGSYYINYLNSKGEIRTERIIIK